MRLRSAFKVLFLCGFAFAPNSRAGAGERGNPREFLGRWLVTDASFPALKETVEIPFPGGDFERTAPPAWPASGEVVTNSDAPQGKRYTRIAAGKGSILMPPSLAIEPGRPYLLSFWLRSPVAEWACIRFPSEPEPRLRTFGELYPGVTDTGSRWRRVGIYFFAPADARFVNFQIQPMKPRAGGQFISVDDLRLRTARFEEMSAANLDERAQLPPYDISPRPGDGRNLTLSAAKWSGAAGIPGKPFVIWAIGSNWTNFQGDGYPLIRAIRERFPHAPAFVYRKRAGSETSPTAPIPSRSSPTATAKWSSRDSTSTSRRLRNETQLSGQIC